MGNKIVVYNRVSTQEQVENGYSLEGMLEKCKLFIASQDDAVLVEVYEDRGFSGTLPPSKRPALNRLLKDVKEAPNKFDMVLVYRIDRLSRALRDAVEIHHILDKSGKSLKSVTENFDTSTASGRMLFSLLAGFAEMESNSTGQRTHSIMSTRCGKQHLGGLPPIGYRLGKGGRYEIDEKRAQIVRIIFEQFLKLKCFSKVAAVLNERGLTTSKGNQWSHRQIKLVLSNQAYISKRIWNKCNARLRRINPVEKWFVCEAAHDPIISEQVFERVEKLCRRK